MNLAVYATGLFAICCYAALPSISKKMLSGGVPPFAFIAVTMVFLATFSAIASYFVEKDFALSKLGAHGLTGLLIFSLVNFVGFSTYLYVITKMPVTHYQLLGLAGPIIGCYVAYLMLNEPIKPQYFIGLLVVAAGFYIAVRDWS